MGLQSHAEWTLEDAGVTRYMWVDSDELAVELSEYEAAMKALATDFNVMLTRPINKTDHAVYLKFMPLNCDPPSWVDDPLWRS